MHVYVYIFLTEYFLDVNECSRSGTCSRNERCVNTYGSYNCIDNTSTQPPLVCATGLEVDSSGQQCQGRFRIVQCICFASQCNLELIS